VGKEITSSLGAVGLPALQGTLRHCWGEMGVRTTGMEVGGSDNPILSRPSASRWLEFLGSEQHLLLPSGSRTTRERDSSLSFQTAAL